MEWSKIAICAVIWISLAGANNVEPEEKVGDEAQDRKLTMYASRTGYSGSSGFGSTPSQSNSNSFDLSKGSSSITSSFGNDQAQGPTVALFGVAGGEYIVYIIMALFTSIYAFFYKSYVVDVILRENRGPIQQFRDVVEYSDDFEVGLFECVSEPCMCLRLLCPCTAVVRQAHTVSVVSNATGRRPICGYWMVFISYVVGGICCCIPPLCLTMFYRMELKQKMGLHDNLLNDFCLSWLCTPCTIGQMAMTVDRELECEVNYCCDLQWDDRAEEAYNMEFPNYDFR
mmetsp:Transcript_97107/g.153117  ORF Transcript_97107/g.153117 Transcript_97107/m.153117 type:complete len:285 (+) Transcript_97107:51-905(+)